MKKNTSEHGGREARRQRGSSPAVRRPRGASPFPKSRGKSPFRFVRRSSSSSSLGSSDEEEKDQYRRKDSNCIVVTHGSARQLVFRDHLRRAAKIIEEEEEDFDEDSSSGSEDEDYVENLRSLRQSIRAGSMGQLSDVAKTGVGGRPQLVKEEIGQSIRNLASTMVPELTDVASPEMSVTERDVKIEALETHLAELRPLELGPQSEFEPLIASPRAEAIDEVIPEEWSQAEKEVYLLLKHQKACVKTLKNSEWKTFLNRFHVPQDSRSSRFPKQHDDIGPCNDFCFNSFVTSTSLLPELGKKMRCYGSVTAYTTGVVFALPEAFSNGETEDEAAKRTRTWAWPAGYAAKTEFNIDSRGELINGREEALLPLSTMRQYNDDYVHKEDHMIAGRLIKGGFNVVPYNEIFLRVGGRSRIVHGKDCSTGEERSDAKGTGRSFQYGVGLPVALFIRTSKIGDIISLLRTRARMSHSFGEEHVRGIPMLFISPELGVRVFTETLQHDFFKLAANELNPFQNPLLERNTKMDDTNEACLEQKMEELLDLSEAARHKLTQEECARLAGGFGATDNSLALVMMKQMIQEKRDSSGNRFRGVRNFVKEGLTASVRSNDYYTARQLLVLYSFVVSEGFKLEDDANNEGCETRFIEGMAEKLGSASTYSDIFFLKDRKGNNDLPQKPLPPPLRIDRLRNATNDGGLLMVLGASQVIRSLEDGGAKMRTEESSEAVKKWVELAEKSVTFRIASWHDQRVAEGDTKIATDTDSKFMAFVSNKAITNRKKFAEQLRHAASQNDVSEMHFLREIYDIIQSMHSPCLRLELIQYVLGLDNRYSVVLAKRSIEFAVTCVTLATA